MATILVFGSAVSKLSGVIHYCLIFSSMNLFHSSAPKDEEMLGSTRPSRTHVGVTWMPFCLRYSLRVSCCRNPQQNGIYLPSFTCSLRSLVTPEPLLPLSVETRS